MLSSLARGSPVDEFSFRDRESDPYFFTLCGDDSEYSLEVANVASVRVGCNGEREVVHIGEHNGPRDCRV